MARVPRLTELCKKLLQANVHQIHDVGDIPYEMLREVLPGCRVDQLREIERLSPQIAEEDDGGFAVGRPASGLSVCRGGPSWQPSIILERETGRSPADIHFPFPSSPLPTHPDLLSPFRSLLLTEIWEAFYARDFPLLAEARQASIDKLAAMPSSLTSAPRAPSNSSKLRETEDANSPHHQDEEGEGLHGYESLFACYRDLYCEAELAREEKLARAGTRLKEKIASLKQQKEQRAVVLDPKLGLNPRISRGGRGRRTNRISPIKTRVGHSNAAQQHGHSRPKTLMEKARLKAGVVAYAYHPPKFTRSSMRIACMASNPSRAKPKYAEVGEDEEGKDEALARSEAPRDKSAPSSNSTPSATQGQGTRFVERSVTVKAKSSIDRPHKEADGLGIPKPVHVKMLPQGQNVHRGPRSRPSPTTSPHAMKLTSKPTDPTPPAPGRDREILPRPSPIKNIPGVTRKPKRATTSHTAPLHMHVGPPPFTSDGPSPSPSSSAASTVSSSPPNWSNVAVAQQYPALSPPTATAASSSSSSSSSWSSSLQRESQFHAQPTKVVRRATPSLFIPRKRAKG